MATNNNNTRLKLLKSDLNDINNDIKKVQQQLINLLKTTNIEYIDLYYFINLIDTLKARKNKIQYLIALEYE